MPVDIRVSTAGDSGAAITARSRRPYPAGCRGTKPQGLALTLTVDWLIEPFTIAALQVLFFEVVFADMAPAYDASQIIAGMILLGAAPCTAMVFVWSHLTDGDANDTLVQVSVNDFATTYDLARVLKLPFNVAAPAAMIGTSNFFELAVAVALRLFGLTSAAALATVMGVLIEVQDMLALVACANRTKGWYPPASSAAA